MAQRPQIYTKLNYPKFAELNNLASEKLGGKVLFATDDWFAAAENLLKEDPPEWREGEFTVYGKWMDGWETRRKRKPGHDWCIIRLGMPGTIAGVDVDTSYFTGNYAPRVSIQAATLAGPEERQLPQRVSGMGREASEVELTQAAKLNSQNWTTIIPMTEAKPGYHDTCHNFLQVTPATSTTRYTHIRLNIFPDGGVARFRVFGSAVPDWSSVSHSQIVDLAAAVSGGSCVGYSDAHYGHPRNLISPGRGINMGDGWETARRLDRPPVLIEDERGVLKVSGYEWAILRLGHTGTVHELEIDTHHFKGNFPDSCRVDGCLLPLDADLQYIKEKAVWKTILPSQKLHSHTQHHFKQEVIAVGQVSHVKVVMAPDGGISRVRVLGKIFNKL
ncbi:hypothetical protein Pcinc_017454 [Petrolisthes cinctipes]|uniref:Allantoate amidinohydrolase n=1 Tax=Petrolisthes cinctipes TaxID=88211 RepID=A0AAE1KPW2_PETCI|nr:hypothetical protein Pcinc_017454 [Petrolisthes cinctipes]